MLRSVLQPPIVGRPEQEFFDNIRDVMGHTQTANASWYRDPDRERETYGLAPVLRETLQPLTDIVLADCGLVRPWKITHEVDTTLVPPGISQRPSGWHVDRGVVFFI